MQLTVLMCFVLTVAVSRSSALCSPTDRRWTQYATTPAPGVFEGESTAVGCSGGNCIGPAFGGTGRLGDQNLGTQTLNGSFLGHAWDQTVSIVFVFPSVTAFVTGMNLYFYNIPSRGIGLPYNIRIISQSDEHLYVLEGNNNLTQEDTGLQSVMLTPQSLSLSPNNPNDRFTIVFEFSNNTDQINVLLLTEVEFCTSSSTSAPFPTPSPITVSSDTLSTISPTNITSSIILSCSVPEGRFDWTWTATNPLTTQQQLVLNAGRTSVLELSGLSSDDMGTYQCQATHTFGAQPRVSATFDIDLTLPGTFRAESTPVEVNANDEIAVMRCFLYGYLPLGEEPSINWQDESNNQQQIFNDSVNTIIIEPGDMFIQNGGDQPVPSLISSLTVNLTRYPLAVETQRLYTCISNQVSGTNFRLITLISIAIPTDQTTPPPTSDTTNSMLTDSEPASEQPAIGAIIGALVGVTLVIIIVIVFMVVVVIIVRRNKKIRNVMMTEYEDVRDMTLSVTENEAYRIKPNTFNMTQNTTYSAGVTGESTEVYEDIQDMPIEGLTSSEQPKEDVDHEYEDLETVTATIASPPS